MIVKDGGAGKRQTKTNKISIFREQKRRKKGTMNKRDPNVLGINGRERKGQSRD